MFTAANGDRDFAKNYIVLLTGDGPSTDPYAAALEACKLQVRVLLTLVCTISQVTWPISQVDCPISQVTCPISQVDCPISQVTCPISQVTKIHSCSQAVKQY